MILSDPCNASSLRSSDENCIDDLYKAMMQQSNITTARLIVSLHQDIFNMSSIEKGLDARSTEVLLAVEMSLNAS